MRGRETRQGKKELECSQGSCMEQRVLTSQRMCPPYAPTGVQRFDDDDDDMLNGEAPYHAK